MAQDERPSSMTLPIDDLFEVMPALDGDGFVSMQKALGYPIIGNLGYGGFNIAFALSSAYKTIEDQHDFHLHSCVGHFLGFAQIDRPLRSRVERLRTSKAFITCRVDVWQERDESRTVAKGQQHQQQQQQQLSENKRRAPVMSIQADFHRQETHSFPAFSIAPRLRWTPPDELPPAAEHWESVARRHGLPVKMARGPLEWFRNYWAYIETRDCPEGVGGQNLNGQAKHLATSQDHLPLAERVSADWIRLVAPRRRQRPDEDNDKRENDDAQGGDDDARRHCLAVAFALDFSVAFTALMHDRKYITDVAVNSSLDFALRFFEVPDMNQWMLREQQSHAGGNARSYSEYRLFDRSGKMVASMTQQSLMRPKKDAKM